MQTYKHFTLVPTVAGVLVYDPRWPAKALYVAESVDRARRWVSAFRDGTTWAAQAALVNGA